MKITPTENIFQEHQLLFKFLQFFGLASFKVERGKPEQSKLFILCLVIQSSCLCYCFYDSWRNKHFKRLSQYALTVLIYDVFSIIRSAYAIVTALKFLLSSATVSRIWTTIDKINEELSRIGLPVRRSRIPSAVAFSVYILLFCVFVVLTYNLQTGKSKLTITFWLVWYIPLFQNLLMEFAFATHTHDLKRGFEKSNRMLEKDIASIQNGKRVFRREKSWKRIRVLKENHFRAYETCKDLNTMFGLHFLYSMVSHFLNGTLNICNIVRLYDSKSPSSLVRYRSAVYWFVIQTLQVLNIVFSGVLLGEQVKREMLLIQQYHILLDDDDPHLNIELQSFILQTLQCPLKFTAAGFFQIDCTLLIQMGVAVISNALFLVQIDKLKRRK